VYGILKQKISRSIPPPGTAGTAEYMEKIKTAPCSRSRRCWRDLYLLKFDKDLSFGERKMLDTARNLLIKELSLAKGVNEDDIRDGPEADLSIC